MRLFGLAFLLTIVTLSASAQTPGLPQKIDEIENAGQLLSQGKVDEAFKQIQEAVKKYPVLPPARLILARMVLRADPKQARVFLEQAATDSPNHPEVYLTNTVVALNEGRVSDTILNATRALELANAPLWTADQKAAFQRESRSMLASCYEMRGDWDNARINLAAWLELDPKNGKARERFAAALFNKNKFDEAYVEFQAAVKDDATSLPASVLMARMYMSRNDAKKAGEFFDKAVKSDPNGVKVHISYADFLLQQANLEAAKIHTETAAKIDPRNIDVRQMQGLMARYVKDNATAVRIFEDILRESPANFLASNQLALVLADMNDEASRKRAMQLAEVNGRQYADNIEALSTLGYCYFRNGFKPQAKQAFQKILGGQRISNSDSAYFIALILADEKASIGDAKSLLKGTLDSPGIFFFRKDAQALYDKLEKENPTPKAPTTPAATKGN